MCIAFGVAFICYNNALSETQQQTYNMTCKQIQLEESPRHRTTDLSQRLAGRSDSTVSLCSQRCDLKTVIPLELFFGYCDECAQYIGCRGTPAPQRHRWIHYELLNGSVFCKHLDGPNHGYFEIPSDQDARGEDNLEWRCFADEFYRDHYLNEWERLSGYLDWNLDAAAAAARALVML